MKRALRAYLERRGREGKAGPIRWNNRAAVVPTALAHGQWRELQTELRTEELWTRMTECQS